MTRIQFTNILFNTPLASGTCPFMHACKDCKYEKYKPYCSEAYWDEEIDLEEIKNILSNVFPNTFQYR